MVKMGVLNDALKTIVNAEMYPLSNNKHY